MRAWKVTHPGAVAGTPAAFTSVARPMPQPGGMLLSVEACGVCRTDLHSDTTGLSEREVVRRTIVYGPNQLVREQRSHWWRQLLRHQDRGLHRVQDRLAGRTDHHRGNPPRPRLPMTTNWAEPACRAS